MYDALTARYTFGCPDRGEGSVPLSSFRRLERLEGTAHPVVYRIAFDCPCGEEHPGLVAHDDLDWAPLGLGAGTFVNLMTDRVEPVCAELSDLAASRIGAGEWPWSFFCYPEQRPRPVFPSSFFLLAPGGRDDAVGLAVHCPGVRRRLGQSGLPASTWTSRSTTTRTIGVVDHVFAADALRTVAEFRAELYSTTFDARRSLL